MDDPGSSSQHARKRPRPETDDEDQKPFLNHPMLYFDDGNIILRTGGTLFCVHKSVISKHSTVFRDLVQQGPNHDRFRGLLQVTMEESREDLECLLNVIYDGLRVDIQQLTVETFPTLATILRMATKYKIERPCTDIITQIRAQWPATLPQHDARQAQLRALPPGEGEVHEDLVVHPASVITLLRECGYNEADILFPLFYALSRTTWQFGGPGLGHHLVSLSAADIERFVVGVERLRDRHATLVVTCPAFNMIPTNPPHFCGPPTQHLWSSVVHTLLVRNGLIRAHEPLEEWRDMIASINALYAQYGVCVHCHGAIVSKINAYRQNLWTLLPAFFEL